MTDLQKQIILNKCYELKQGGYDHFNDSDIMDILEECERNNQPLSRKELESLIHPNGSNNDVQDEMEQDPDLNDKKAVILDLIKTTVIVYGLSHLCWYFSNFVPNPRLLQVVSYGIRLLGRFLICFGILYFNKDKWGL